MINYSEIESVFAEQDITVYEYNVELNDATIETPFVVYTVTSNDDFQADGINYMRFLNVGLALIDETLNFEMQRNIEFVLTAYDTSYDKQIGFDEEVRLYTINYYFSVFDDVGIEAEV